MNFPGTGALAAEDQPGAPIDRAELETAGGKVLSEFFGAARELHNLLERLVLLAELKFTQTRLVISTWAIGRPPQLEQIGNV